MSLLNVGVLGSGNFGGQIASLAVENGFPAIAINASDQDLKLLDERVIKFIVGDGKGTGKSADYAREFLLQHLSFVKDEVFEEFVMQNDVIVVAASAGGGFGANTAPVLTQILAEMYPEKLFVTLTVYPAEDETYTAQVNTQNYMRSIIEANVPYLVYDNDKFKKLSPTEAAKKVNQNIIEDLKVLRGDYIAETNIGGIDARDLLTTLSTPGRMIIDMINPLEESNLVDNSIVNTIRQHMNETAHAALVDDKIIMASAVSYCVNRDLDKYTAAVKSELQNVFGVHVTDYRNEAVNPEALDSYVCTILSGLNAPTTRIDRIIARKEDIDRQLNERQKAVSKLDAADTESKHTLTAKKFGSANAAPSQDKDLDDLIKKFMK